MEPAGVALCVSGKFGGQSSGAGALGQRHCPKVHKAGAAALAREVLESLGEIKFTVQVLPRVENLRHGVHHSSCRYECNYIYHNSQQKRNT